MFNSAIIRFDEQAVAFASQNCLSKFLWEKFRTPLSPKDDNEFLLKLTIFAEGNYCPIGVTTNSQDGVPKTVDGAVPLKSGEILKWQR